MDKRVNHTFVLCAYQESKYIEECLISLLAQTVPTNVIIATSTPNLFLEQLANQYGVEMVINHEAKGIGYDFDFALSLGTTEYVTVAHQDDRYDQDYVKYIMENVDKNTIIAFSQYYEDRNGRIVDNNLNLNIKKLLLSPLKSKRLSKYKIVKRAVLSLGCPICCPSVTFHTSKVFTPLFACSMKCDIDWYAWEQLSKLKGEFVYVTKPLMTHRIHEESTTTKILQDNARIKEDIEMFQKFWPPFIAKLLSKLYVKSQNSNNIN